MIFREAQKKSGVFNRVFILFDSNIVNHSSMEISNTQRKKRKRSVSGMSKELINEGLQYFEKLYEQKTSIGHFVVTKKGNLLLKKGLLEYEKLTSLDLLYLIDKAVKDASDEERAVILMNLYHELRPIITLLKKDFFDYLTNEYTIEYLSSIERNFLIIFFGVEEYIKKFYVEEI